MKKLVLIAALLSASAAHAASCDEDTIESVNNGVLVMESGHVYRGQSSDTAGWMGMDDVLVCGDDEIINKDENGEQADVSKLN